MGFCWAEKYSQCKGQLSREHLVSSGVFEQKNIYVQGFDWCKENEKEVSIASLTSKILCEKHNNGLSDIDQAGINAVKIIESTLPQFARSVDTSKTKKYIDGHKFERWLLKIAINISVKGINQIGVGMVDSQTGVPSAYLLAVIFGELNFTHEMGLYFLFPNGKHKFEAGSFHVFPIFKEQVIAAFVFHIRGVDLLLNLFPGHSPPPLRGLEINNDAIDINYILDATPQYRSKSIIVTNENKVQQQVYFKWQ